MIRQGAVALAVMAIAAASPSARSQAMRASDLGDFCATAGPSATGYTACIAYIRGFQDGAVLGGSIGKMYCIPDGVDGFQIAKVYAKWVNDNPEKGHVDPGVAMYAALLKAYPCE